MKTITLIVAILILVWLFSIKTIVISILVFAALTMVPAPGSIFGTAREIAGGRMWTIHHEGCTVDANFFSGRLPKQHAIVKCNCGQSVQITEALTFEDQL